jgi:hypothetical protein
MSSYQLVNPYIGGEFKTTFAAKSPFNAAKDAWQSLSPHLTSYVPRFAFTMQRLSDGKFFHYVIKEEIINDSSSGKNVNYSLSDLGSDKKYTDELDMLRKNIDGYRNKKGGKGKKSKKDDDDSSDSDSDLDDSDDEEIYSKVRSKNSQPITWFVYYPLKTYKIKQLYLPTFVLPLTPTVQINMSSAFLG